MAPPGLGIFEYVQFVVWDGLGISFDQDRTANKPSTLRIKDTQL